MWREQEGSGKSKMGKGDDTEPPQHPQTHPTDASANPRGWQNPSTLAQSLRTDTNPCQRWIPCLSTHRGSVPASRLRSSSPECLSHRSSLSSL